MFNLKHVRPFLAVASCGSVVAAARALRRAQSAVTRSVRELERELAAELFERRPHGMVPTAEGHSLRARAERAFATMEAARQALGGDGVQRTAPVFTLSVNQQRLRTVMLLAEQHNMGAVATRLGISQPAVSQSVREIETSVGVPLFRRGAQGILPTAAGATLARHLKLALAELRMGEEEVLALRGLAHGSVAIGALSLGRALLLPRAIAVLLERFPALTVRTVEGTFEHLATQLRDGDIDFILGALRPPSDTADFLRETVAHDRMVVLARREHPILAKGRIDMAQLARLRWVLPPAGTPTRELLESSLRLMGIARPLVQVESADPSLTLGLLLGSDLISAASPQTFHREITDGEVAIVPVRLPRTERPVGTLQRVGGIPSEAARSLLSILRDLGGALDGSGQGRGTL